MFVGATWTRGLQQAGLGDAEPKPLGKGGNPSNGSGGTDDAWSSTKSGENGAGGGRRSTDIWRQRPEMVLTPSRELRGRKGLVLRLGDAEPAPSLLLPPGLRVRTRYPVLCPGVRRTRGATGSHCSAGGSSQGRSSMLPAQQAWLPAAVSGPVSLLQRPPLPRPNAASVHLQVFGGA